MSDASIRVEGYRIASVLNVRYDGPQYFDATTNDFRFHVFTDSKTGTTFGGTSMQHARRRLAEVRKSYDM